MVFLGHRLVDETAGRKWGLNSKLAAASHNCGRKSSGNLMRFTSHHHWSHRWSSGISRQVRLEINSHDLPPSPPIYSSWPIQIWPNVVYIDIHQKNLWRLMLFGNISWMKNQLHWRLLLCKKSTNHSHIEIGHEVKWYFTPPWLTLDS